MSTGQGNPGDLIKNWTLRDWMVVGGGVVAFIFSLFDYVGASGTIAGIHYSASISAWHSYAILGLLLLFAASVAWALRASKVATLPPLPAKFEVIAGAAAGLGTLLILLRGLTYSSEFGGAIGLRFGGIVLILAGVVVTSGALWAFVLDGGSLKSPLSGSTKKAGSSSGFGAAPTAPSGPWTPSPPPQATTAPPSSPPAAPPTSRFPSAEPPPATPAPPSGQGFAPPPSSAPTPPPFAPPPAPPGAPAESETPPE